MPDRKPTLKTAVQTKAIFNSKAFLNRYSGSALLLSIFVFLLFCFSVFKNIKYPLFWADESITAVGGQRVLKFGYPKVHDGKNVFYDLLHSNKKLGIDEKTDAYVGGAAWLQYYIAAIALKFTSFSNDIYTQTGILRSFFAASGIAGMLLFIILLSRLFEDRFSKFLLAFLFFSLCLFSVSLTLILREVRYYSPNIFLVCFIVGYYATTRFNNGNKKLYPIISCIALLLEFHTFPPAFFILITSLGISEAAIGFSQWLQNYKLKHIIIKSLPFTFPIALSLVGVLISLPYFRTFQIAKQMAIYNANNSGTFWSNLRIIFSYFWKFELLWLALLTRLLTLTKIKTLIKSNEPKFKVSLFLTLVFIVYCLAITRIPNFIYTRYFSPCIILLNAIILLDLFTLQQLYKVRTLPALQFKIIGLTTLGIILIITFIVQNNKEISAHITELSETYKGPLDYTIPYIKKKYQNTDKLVIATNYEESSYMFYLNSKVIAGYIGNNLAEDTLLTPDIISIRKKWTFNKGPLDDMLNKAHYQRVTFPVHDNPVNNIPELNFVMDDFNHLFETLPNNSDEDATDIYIIKRN